MRQICNLNDGIGDSESCCMSSEYLVKQEPRYPHMTRNLPSTKRLLAKNTACVPDTSMGYLVIIPLYHSSIL